MPCDIILKIYKINLFILKVCPLAVTPCTYLMIIIFIGSLPICIQVLIIFLTLSMKSFNQLTVSPPVQVRREQVLMQIWESCTL